MDAHKKLNELYKYLSEYLFTYNNTSKPMGADYTYDTGFNPVTISDILFGIPSNEYRSCRISGTGEENKFVIEMIMNEYTIGKGDYEIENNCIFDFSRTLNDVKGQLSGQGIAMNFNKIEVPVNVFRDNFAQNGKCRIVCCIPFEITFD